MKTLVFGEVLWDIYPNAEYIGGAPLNFAAHLSKLGEKVALMTGVGNDLLGERALNIINGFGVNSEFSSKVHNKETGKCYVSFDENNTPSYKILEDTACDYISACDNANDFDVLYFGTLALRGDYNINTVEKLIKINDFKEIFVDINIRPPFYSDLSINFALSNATIIKISAEELSVVADACNIKFDGVYKNFALSLSRKFENLKLVIITLGDKGAACFDVDNSAFYETPCVKVEVVSTVGAGDSFSAAFVRKYLGGSGIEECLKYAAKVSAFVVASSETVPNYDPKIFE